MATVAGVLRPDSEGLISKEAGMATPGGGKGRGMAWLLGGIVVGILGTIFLPRLAAPYLPEVL